MSIAYPPTSVPYKTFVRAQQAQAKKAQHSRLLTAFLPPFTQVFPAFLPPSCATVASMSTFYRFPYKLTGYFADLQISFQVDCRLRPSHTPRWLQCRTDEKRQQSARALNLERIHQARADSRRGSILPLARPEYRDCERGYGRSHH